MFKVAVLFVLLSVTANAFALRCGTRVVSPGDDLLKVLSECGQPALRQHWIQRRVVYFNARHWSLATADVDPVMVNLWTYNFGRLRFMQQLRFENGRLVHIKSLGYGY